MYNIHEWERAPQVESISDISCLWEITSRLSEIWHISRVTRWTHFIFPIQPGLPPKKVPESPVVVSISGLETAI